jgi:hypothetical protein
MLDAKLALPDHLLETITPRSTAVYVSAPCIEPDCISIINRPSRTLQNCRDAVVIAAAPAAAAKQMCESAEAGKLHITDMEIANPFL